MAIGSTNRVLVTGATGLLGAHLVRHLVLRNAEVVALVRDEVPRSLFHCASKDWNLMSRVTAVRGELENLSLLERTINEYEIDTVFHLGAQTIVGTANRNPIQTFKSNIEGTWNVLEACRMHSRLIKSVIIASSDKAYGNLQGEKYHEEYPLRGEHPYDVSKSCADLISQSYFKTYQLPVSITRCGNFFGPGDLNFNRLIPGTIRDVHQGRKPVIRSDGKFVRDYIYVEDGVLSYLALADAMSEGRCIGEAFNFSYELRLSVLDVVAHILELMGKTDVKPDILNEAVNEIPVQTLDSSKAKRELKWGPKFGFEQGLKNTIEWYCQLT